MKRLAIILTATMLLSAAPASAQFDYRRDDNSWQREQDRQRIEDMERRQRELERQRLESEQRADIERRRRILEEQRHRSPDPFFPSNQRYQRGCGFSKIC